MAVLVPPDQRLAIARVLQMSRTGSLDERALSLDSESVPKEEPAEPVTPMLVQALEVPQIDVTDAAIEGAHERN